MYVKNTKPQISIIFLIFHTQFIMRAICICMYDPWVTALFLELHPFLTGTFLALFDIWLSVSWNYQDGTLFYTIHNSPLWMYHLYPSIQCSAISWRTMCICIQYLDSKMPKSILQTKFPAVIICRYTVVSVHLSIYCDILLLVIILSVIWLN